MSRRNDNAPDGQVRGVSADAASKRSQHRERSAQLLLRATGVRYRRAGQAGLDWCVVRRCPLCQYPHRHLLFHADGQVVNRAPSCARHRRYVVQLVDVVPSVVTGRSAA